MEKIEVILVVWNDDKLLNAINAVNFNNADLKCVLMEGGDGKFIKFDNATIPIVSFREINNVLSQANNAVWLIYGGKNGLGDIYKMKKFLIENGVNQNNVVNFDVISQATSYWVGNIRYIEENAVDYFATGISYTEVGLNLNCIPKLKGVNLASTSQDLRLGYLMAKYVFDHVKPGTIKFVLIGLAPYSLRYDNIESFAVCVRNFQYELILQNSLDNSPHGQYLRLLVSDNVKNFFTSMTSAQADLNYDNIKIIQNDNFQFPANAIINWEDELKILHKTFRPATIDKNLQILEDYIKLCLDNGAKPVAFVLPFAPLMRKKYSDDVLIPFRRAIKQLEKIYDFKCIDLFDLILDYSNFYNMSHLNLRGSTFVSNILSFELWSNNILPSSNFEHANYQDLYYIGQVVDKNRYNNFVEQILKINVEKLRRKDKINVGFVTYDASMWCGDELYNLFAQSDRYNPTVFLCLRRDTVNANVIEDFQRGVKQFQDAGLNVIGVSENDTEIPHQDVFIFLTPYIWGVLPNAFQLSNLTADTLLTYLPYSFQITPGRGTFQMMIFSVVWKYFFESREAIKLAEVFCRNGMPRGVYSGYPKVDVFFKDNAKINFAWKMARPESKKIIYAPHWSIDDGVKFATFQWNYKFMYEYAKAHPEISWVFKPHPNLLFSAVEKGVFSSVEAFNEYLREWDNLPNAKVVTGAYYQDIFATSDGMILDSGSFIAEYQYTHKPMIFLTRDTQNFNDMTSELMKNLYRVDGRDLDGIANLMQKVFIDGNDDMYQARMEFFDKYLNYVKSNGMLASEYIFKSITQELE